MEVTFRKNLSKSYMCVEEQGQPLEEYELYILEKHKIPGLLRMQGVFAEGKRRYLYDISGKQQIEDYFSGKKIGYEVLRKFLLSVREMCANLSEYLLREDGICLEMEFIYVNLEDGSLQFTYLPFYEKSLQDAFESCMEQFLRKIDHQDKAAVELGYRVYQLCDGGNANIEKVLEASLGKILPQEKEEPLETVEVSAGENEKREREVPEKVERIWKSGLERKKYQIAEAVDKYLPGFSKTFMAVFEKMGEKHMKKEVKRVTGPQKKNNKVTVFKRRYKQADHTEEVQETLETASLKDADAPVHPTEILGVQEKHPVGKLVYQGLHQCEDILLEGESFLLGKNSGQVDGVIPAEGVSRLHARISRQEDRYFIEDLNSTNGTYLNDSVLEYHQPREIKKNDRIRFGAEEYLFL